MRRKLKEYRVIQIDDINIGNNIKAIREEQGLKQTDVVKQLQLRGVDISVYSYNRIEKGTQNSTVSFLLGICEILGCNMNHIFGIADKKNENEES
uniref:helix-turn-helix domain-containing protein n=1 Tax=Acetatifactor sp. TaxID=1872090 RepID=UPI004056C6DC